MSPVTSLDLGLQPLPALWDRMRQFTDARTGQTGDQIWFVEHPPIFTLGMRADVAHLRAPGDIPVLRLDRGGQVTYHGPGQLVVYPLLDLRRLGLTVRRLIESLEQAVIETVAGYGVEAKGRRDAPGVYVAGSKLAAVGLRVRRHCSYHGIAINVAMDLAPFGRINPCGFESLAVTQLSELCGVAELGRVRRDLEPRMIEGLGL